MIEDVARTALGTPMADAASAYEKVLKRARLEESISPMPQVFAAPEAAWTTLTVRYIVPARERRRWKSQLVLAIAEALAKPEHKEKIVAVLPRQQLQFIGADGRPL